MSKQDETNNEYFCLKLLLENWKLPHLLHHFISQKINVEILKIMKPRHINEAVSCFPLGDRIRFEHEFENWRDSMGIPLDGNKKPSEPSIIPLKEEKANEAIQVEATQTAQQTSDAPTPRSTPSSPGPTTNPRPSPIPKLRPSPSPKKTPIILEENTPTSRPATPTDTQTVSRSMRQPNSRRKHFSTAAPSTTTKKKRSNIDFVPPKELITTSPMNIDVTTILMQSAPRGPQLMLIYETRHCFTPSERCELINLIAKFFYQNSIHLSVKMAHALENQILKLFPGERLKDYRKDKRGRIYIRLGNIKNFRARTARARQHHDELQQQQLQQTQQFLITSVDEDDDDAVIVNEGLNDEVTMLDESNSSDRFLSDGLRTDIETNSADHFVCDVVKTEAQEENGVFEPETQLELTEHGEHENILDD